VQEHRWNYSADLTNKRTTGDIQSAGMIITSKEKTGAGARLLAVQTGSAPIATVIFNQPQDQSLNLGATLNLSVTTDSSSAVTYQWKKDGGVIAGATAPSLVISAAGLTDAGTYTCEVTNSYGTSTSAAATVAVSAAPVLGTALRNTTVYVGDTVTLSAAFTGSPAPTYSWTRNGMPIPGATDSTYTFIPAATTESGTYTVTALNTYGSLSSSATVTVSALPTSFKNISSSSFTYTQNFDGLEKSSSYNIRGTTYAPWVDGGTNGSTSFEGWSCTLDQGFLGYRSLNNSSSSNLMSPPPEGEIGLLSMGSASSSTDRSLGGLPWANNKVYMGMRLKNGTGKVINGCTISFAVEQFSSTSSGKSDTTLTFATQVNAASLKTGTWVSRGVYLPMITSTSYANLNGASNANRTTQTLVLGGLNIGPNDDLWLRWTVSSTSSEPLAMGVDDLTINNIVLVNQTFTSAMGGVSPTSDLDYDGMNALLEYALGGSMDRNDQDRMPAVTFSNNELSLTYLARTDDTSLSVLPEVSMDLTSNSVWISSTNPNSGITVTILGTVDINGTTFERRRATVAIDSTGAKFMRIKTTLNQ